MICILANPLGSESGFGASIRRLQINYQTSANEFLLFLAHYPVAHRP